MLYFIVFLLQIIQTVISEKQTLIWNQKCSLLWQLHCSQVQ